MRIEIDLPDWCDERHIYIMAGIEMVAYKLAHEDKLMVKSVRCAKCGRCCQNLSRRRNDVDQNGDCLELIPDGPGYFVCGKGVERPFGCSVGMQRKGRIEGCSVEYK